MQTTQELSPRSAEPAVLDATAAGDSSLGLEPLELGERDSLWERDEHERERDRGLRDRLREQPEQPDPPAAGDAVLRTLQGLTMTVKQEDAEDSAPAAPSAAAASPQRHAESPASGRPMSASSRSSPSMTLDRLSPAMTQPQQTYQQQQQLQLRQIHQRIKEQQQQLQQQQQQQQPQQRETYRGTESGRGRGRRRSRWKLKFHHQALPPEYLDHYEASLAGGGAGRGGRDSGDDKARVIGSRAPRNPDRNKRPAPAASNAAATAASSASAAEQLSAAALPPLAPKPANGADTEGGLPLSFPAAPLPIPVPMPFGLEVLTRYQALLGQGKTDLDPAAFVAGNLMSIMAQPGAAPEHAKQQEEQANGQRALLSSLLGAQAQAASSRREPLDVGRSLPHASASKVMTFQDLPYMGEMTLDNMKPRRGRKPKKADICHLIYKNYGTVFPRDVDEEAPAPPTAAPAPAPAHLTAQPPAPALPPRLSRSDVQSRIISSLLEKRLTQEEQAALAARPVGAEEPLNLCVRDHNPLKIKLLRRHGNFYESNGGGGSSSSSSVATAGAVKSEPASPESEVIEVDADPSLVNQEDDDEENEEEEDEDGDGKTAADEAFPRQNMLYWGGAGGAQGHPMYVHPLLYGKGFPQLPAAMAQLPPLQVMSPLPPLPPLLRLPGLEDEPPAVPSPMAAPPSRAGRHEKQQQQQHSPSRPSSRSGRAGTGGGKARAVASSPAASPAPSPGPAPSPSPPKRKRSAIFIPPVPPESSNNPTTEVSICKFKFTGGAKPSLQEKKMLSVDAGGNFRYYSGTGDKSMRGYEFFPRESMQQQQQQQQQQQLQQQQQQLQLQQQQLLPKPYPAQTPPQPQSENLRTLLFQNVMESLHMPQQGLLGFPPQQMPLVGAAPAVGWDADPDSLLQQQMQRQMQQQMQQHHRHLLQQQHPNASRKRKTRKSLEREKLERTFKEKGFLIQTQQLESAEGATYCKFRQLRKFTRYLFRSWKDYLPGGVREGEEGHGPPGPGPPPVPPLADDQPAPVYSLGLEDAEDVDNDLL